MRLDGRDLLLLHWRSVVHVCLRLWLLRMLWLAGADWGVYHCPGCGDWDACVSCAGQAIYAHVPAMVRAGRDDEREQQAVVRRGGGKGARKKKNKKNKQRR